MAEAFRAAIPYDRRTSRGAARDAANARQLIRHRRRRRVGLGAAAALVLAVLAAQLRPGPGPVETTSPLPTAVATMTPLPKPACDTSQRTCQRAQTYAWQATMAGVAGSYLDPGGDYFTVYRTADDRLNQPGFWVSEGSALGIDLLRRGQRGATQVSVQIATSRLYAVGCGTATHATCISMRFMDGNRFTLTESTRVEEGMEVQFSPDGTQVITVIARNTTSGQPLAIDRGRLIQLVQDSRMRLPVR